MVSFSYKVLTRHVVGHSRPASVALTFFFFLYRYCYCYCGFVASHWFGGSVSSFCSPQGLLVFRIRRCHRLSGNIVITVFMPATGARPKAAKINLMDCSCLCSQIEIILSETKIALHIINQVNKVIQ